MSNQPDEKPERYFYHSFPRRGPGESDEQQLDRGQRILEAISEIGLVLAPEDYEIRESLDNGGQSLPMTAYQKRICFSELSPTMLPGHSSTFGPFALEWEIQTLRSMGVMPVFYVPLNTNNALEGIGAAMLCRLGEIQVLLHDLAKNEAVLQSADPKTPFELPDGSRYGTVGQALQLLATLRGAGQPFSQLEANIQGLTGLFQAVENLKYTDELGYYRQREWRLVSGLLDHGKPQSRLLDDHEKKTILGISGPFFEKEELYPDGSGGRTKQRRIDVAHVVSEHKTSPVRQTVRRIIVPAARLESVEQYASDASWDVPIAALESLTSS